MKKPNALGRPALAATMTVLTAVVAPHAQAMPFSATVMAGFNSESMVTVGTLDFDVAAGDGSVRTFDYAKAFGDGSVRKSGDGSVRSCDGSVMPAGGACDAPIALGGFAFDGTFDADPFIDFSLAAVNLTGKPLSFVFSFASPFSGGGYNTFATDLTGSGDAESIQMDGSIDGSVVPGVAITCTTPAACADPTVTLSPPTNATGGFAARLAFTLLPVVDGSASFQGKAVLSQIDAPPPAVPEPATLSLLLAGLLVGGRLRRRDATDFQ